MCGASLSVKNNSMLTILADDEISSRYMADGASSIAVVDLLLDTGESEDDTFDALVTDILTCAVDDALNSDKMFKKLSEEVGEYGRALLIESGDLPEKTLDEPAMGELADVIITAVAVHMKHALEQRTHSADEVEVLLGEIKHQIQHKMKKYRKVIGKRNDAKRKDAVYDTIPFEGKSKYAVYFDDGYLYCDGKRKHY